VVVVDKQGKFVEGLKPEQFLLKVDGQPVTPSFVEHVIAGTKREEKLETLGATSGAVAAIPSEPSYRARTIIFFVDDLHLSADSVQRTRKEILEFVENEMTIEDQVAVTSPSGQIGFLERFSDLKPVVRAAVGRLNHKPYSVRDHEQIPMTEYQAVRIDQGDNSASDYFVTELMKASTYKTSVDGGMGPPSGGPANASRAPKNTAGLTPEMARRMVKDRASLIVRQSEAITSGTLSSLESLMRSVTHAPGRKVVFLISDGFFMNDRSTGFVDKVHRIADAAVRGGAIVYSIDARGLGSTIDASSNRSDPLGQLARANVGEQAASQDGMNAMAANTGGKLFMNTPLTAAVNEVLKETSHYYLVAWRPSTADQKSPNFKRLEVSIVGRPELTVRVPRGFFVTEPKTETATKAEAADATAKGVEADIVSALSSPTAKTGLPTRLAVSFIDVPGSGPVLTAATQMATDVLGYGADGKQPAAIDLAGVVLNDLGKQAGSFKTRLNVNPLPVTASANNPTVQYTHKLPLKPGIYQVRVAARDDKSGRVGSAAQWIEIPDLSSKTLTLSSLLVGGQFIGASSDQEQMVFSVDRRFLQGSQMTFLTMIYNAGAAPQLDAQIEILRGGQRVIASPVRPIEIDKTDLARIPYGATVALKALPPGRYVLRVTVSDRNTNTRAVNQVLFEVVS
jgi:VWFA-related protein